MGSQGMPCSASGRPMRSHWEAIDCIEEQAEIHIVPQGDLCPHYLEDECICGPDAEVLMYEDGDVYMYVHHALDPDFPE